MTKYDLSDIGYRYKGIASIPSKTIKCGSWEIIDVPIDVRDEDAGRFTSNFINGICAVELPTSLICNLRCRYCYIDDPRMKNKKVSKESIEKILISLTSLFPGFSPSKQQRIDRNSSTAKKSMVYFSPWGAEPFCNIDTLETIQNYAFDVYGKGEYQLHTSTNGTIWNGRIETFFQNLLNDEAFRSIQISLDGPEDLQNKQRPFLNGSPSFDKVRLFVENLERIKKENNLSRRLHSFCSTIHLQDENFVNNWIDAADFFSTPQQWHSVLPFIPMRMSGEDMQSEEHINRFIEAQRKMVELVKSKVLKGIPVIDFYTSKLFGGYSNRSRNAFPYCSALNTQIGVDLDGCLYPCHGPVTSPMYKPFLWFGNLFEKIISYKQLFRNFSYQYGTAWTRSRCAECPVEKYSTGNICWSCPSHNLAMTGEPSMDSVIRCIAYAESFKYWVQIAKMNIDNPVLKNIPECWFNEVVNLPEIKNKLKAIDEKYHFDLNYNGMIQKGVSKFILQEPCHLIDQTTTWWEFDNYNTKF